MGHQPRYRPGRDAGGRHVLVNAAGDLENRRAEGIEMVVQGAGAPKVPTCTVGLQDLVRDGDGLGRSGRAARQRKHVDPRAPRKEGLDVAGLQPLDVRGDALVAGDREGPAQILDGPHLREAVPAAEIGLGQVLEDFPEPSGLDLLRPADGLHPLADMQVRPQAKGRPEQALQVDGERRFHGGIMRRAAGRSPGPRPPGNG